MSIESTTTKSEGHAGTTIPDAQEGITSTEQVNSNTTVDSGSNTPPAQQQLSWQKEREHNGQWYAPETVIRPYYELHNAIPPPVPWTNHHLRPPGSPWPPTSQPRKVSQSQGVSSTGLAYIRESQAELSFVSSTTSFQRSPPASAPPSASVQTPAIYGPDNVDLLDVSDPWGMRWHHDGRYDVGDFTNSTRGPSSSTWAGTSSPSPVEIPQRPRTRAGSPAAASQQRKQQTLHPSPLSQSTSAIELRNSSSISLDTPKNLTRRLSKRRDGSNNTSPSGTPTTDVTPQGKRTSAIRALFASSGSNNDLPPGRRRTKTLPSGESSMAAAEHAKVMLSRKVSNTQNVQPLPSPIHQDRESMSPSPTKGKPKEKEKRSSMLGRLVKKFSVVRREQAPYRRSAGGVMENRSSALSSEQRTSTISGSSGALGIKRSASALNTGSSSHLLRPPEDSHHLKVASAPESTDYSLSTVEPPILPDLRLTETQLQPSPKRTPQPSPKRTPQPSPKRTPSPSKKRLSKASSEGRSSPEPQLAQFGGLMVTNPDANNSEAGSIGFENPRRRGPVYVPPESERNTPPRPAFFGGGTASAESTPSMQMSTLRVVTNPDMDTDTDRGTVYNPSLTPRNALPIDSIPNIPTPRSLHVPIFPEKLSAPSPSATPSPKTPRLDVTPPSSTPPRSSPLLTASPEAIKPDENILPKPRPRGTRQSADALNDVLNSPPPASTLRYATYISPHLFPAVLDAEPPDPNPLPAPPARLKTPSLLNGIDRSSWQEKESPKITQRPPAPVQTKSYHEERPNLNPPSPRRRVSSTGTSF